jgi:hypothetical protein
MNEGREGGENVDVHRVNKGSRKVRKGVMGETVVKSHLIYAILPPLAAISKIAARPTKYMFSIARTLQSAR